MSLAESLDILFEDNHCLALNKPAGWPTTHFDGHEETVDRLAKSYLKEKYGKPGKVYLGVVHRLDKPVSGVLMFARTSKSAGRLSQQFRDGAVEKVYWAVVENNGSRLVTRGAKQQERGKQSELAGTLEDWLFRDEAAGRIVTVPEETPGAQHALLHYEKKAEHDGLSLLELRPQTGRKHQLRVQLASRGFPVFGDGKYGSAHTFGPAIALHASSLTFLHPTRLEPITLEAEVPHYWKGRFAHLLKPGAGK